MFNEDFNYALYADVDCKEDTLIIQQIEDSNDNMIDKDQTMMDFINDPFYVKETAEAISNYILSLKDSNR